MSRIRSRRAHSARVAAVATLIVLALYVLSVLSINFIVVRRLTNTVDQRLTTQLASAQASAGAPSGSSIAHPRSTGTDTDIDYVPIVIWQVGARGGTISKSPTAQALPPRTWTSQPRTMTIGQSAFRLAAVPYKSGWLVAGQSIAEIVRVQSFLVVPELIVGLLLVVTVFFASLLIGLRASAPLDDLRRRQEEFTADASHELRTPLSVIEAEAALALKRERSPEEYVGALSRISAESTRLRSIVEDLMWLSRASGAPESFPETELIDLSVSARTGVDRFGAIAETSAIDLSLIDHADAEAVLRASPEWIDRLIGVLVDNACKYAGEGGRVQVIVGVHADRLFLAVEDSGPGIPAAQHHLVFDRFRRAAASPNGTGLGLAIADTVVQASKGSWSIGRSGLGGARMEVSWHREKHPEPNALRS